MIASADYEKKGKILSMEVFDMLRHQLAKYSIASICIIFAGIAFAEDFSSYSDESTLLKAVMFASTGANHNYYRGKPRVRVLESGKK